MVSFLGTTKACKGNFLSSIPPAHPLAGTWMEGFIVTQQIFIEYRPGPES